MCTVNDWELVGIVNCVMWRGYTLEWTKNDGTVLVGHQTCLEWTKNDGTALVGHQTCF